MQMRRERLPDNLELRLSVKKLCSIENYRDLTGEQEPITSTRFGCPYIILLFLLNEKESLQSSSKSIRS